jgi:hypothetical protein
MKELIERIEKWHDEQMRFRALFLCAGYHYFRGLFLLKLRNNWKLSVFRNQIPASRHVAEHGAPLEPF